MKIPALSLAAVIPVLAGGCFLGFLPSRAVRTDGDSYPLSAEGRVELVSFNGLTTSNGPVEIRRAAGEREEGRAPLRPGKEPAPSLPAETRKV